MPTVKIINNKVDNKNAILGLKKIAAIMITAGIGKIYGDEPVGRITAVKQVSATSIPESDINLGSRYVFSKNFKYPKNMIVTNKTSIYTDKMPCQFSS